MQEEVQPAFPPPPPLPPAPPVTPTPMPTTANEATQQVVDFCERGEAGALLTITWDFFPREGEWNVWTGEIIGVIPAHQRESPSERLQVRWTERVKGDVELPTGVVVFPPPVAIVLFPTECRMKRTRAPWRPAGVHGGNVGATPTAQQQPPPAATRPGFPSPQATVDAATYRVLAPLVGEDRLDDTLQRRDIAPGLKFPETDTRNLFRSLYVTDYLGAGNGMRWRNECNDMLRRTNTRLRQDHLNDQLQEQLDIVEILIEHYAPGTWTKATLFPLMAPIFSIFRLMVIAKSDDKAAAKADALRRKLIEDYNSPTTYLNFQRLFRPPT